MPFIIIIRWGIAILIVDLVTVYTTVADMMGIVQPTALDSANITMINFHQDKLQASPLDASFL